MGFAHLVQEKTWEDDAREAGWRLEKHSWRISDKYDSEKNLELTQQAGKKRSSILHLIAEPIKKPSMGQKRQKKKHKILTD